MLLNRNKLYLILFTACIAGYIWLYIVLRTNFNSNSSFEICLIKNISTIPCPSCGSTRSVISLLNGNFKEAFFLNPFGYVVAIIMFVSPLWVFFDVITKKKSLFEFYKKMEIKLKSTRYAIPLIVFVFFNWIWNILKGF
jgi:hypothetical protein